MKEKPILFNTEMVQAILDGRKTQTRRVMKPQPPKWVENFGHSCFTPKGHISGRGNFEGQLGEKFFKLKYQKGDILWVRETWRWFDALIESDQDGVYSGYQYKASTHESEEYKWKPSIHMPKDAARIWLKVTNVRCERLQDISWGECRDEGWPINIADGAGKWFFDLWKSINGPDSWFENPWVWVYEFEVLSTTGKP